MLQRALSGASCLLLAGCITNTTNSSAVPVIMQSTQSAQVAQQGASPRAPAATSASLASSRFISLSQIVPAGGVLKLGSFASLHPDCSPDGQVTVKLQGVPAHGTVSIVTTTDFTSYEPNHPNFRCNTQRTAAVVATYKPDWGFRGMIA